MANEKITLTIESTTGPSGALYPLVDNLTNQNSQVEKAAEGTNLVIDFPFGIKPENTLKADETTILAILEEG